jgi:hypothetical protein
MYKILSYVSQQVFSFSHIDKSSVCFIHLEGCQRPLSKEISNLPQFDDTVCREAARHCSVLPHTLYQKGEDNNLNAEGTVVVTAWINSGGGKTKGIIQVQARKAPAADRSAPAAC